MAKKNMQMSENDLKDLISNAADTTADRVIKGLRKQRFLKDKNLTAYQKTEQVLYNYNNFKETIKDKKEQIEEIKTEGLNYKSKDITFYHSAGFNEFDDIITKIDEKIQSIKDSIALTERYIKTIDTALEKIRDDKYFDIINLKYFQNKTVDEIAEYFGNKDPSTINRNKSRLINQLKIILFSDEVIKELLS
jgi:hypothetical protein